MTNKVDADMQAIRETEDWEWSAIMQGVYAFKNPVKKPAKAQKGEGEEPEGSMGNIMLTKGTSSVRSFPFCNNQQLTAAQLDKQNLSRAII
jgi:hypothetical protein